LEKNHIHHQEDEAKILELDNENSDLNSKVSEILREMT